MPLRDQLNEDIKAAMKAREALKIEWKPAGAFDSGGLTTPSVFLVGATWNMYYAGFDTSGQFLAGLARAPRQ